MSEVPAAANSGLLRVSSSESELEQGVELGLVAAHDREDTKTNDTDTEEREEEVSAKTGEVSEQMPWGSLLPLCFQQFCETWNSDSIYAYVSFLVLDFAPGLSTDQAGRMAGYVAGSTSVICFSYFFSFFLQGRIFWGSLRRRTRGVC
jgi:hypothetical protein